MIRAAMDIKLEGAVLIFDEGHNIEDVARCSVLGDSARTMLLTPCRQNRRAVTGSVKA